MEKNEQKKEFRLTPAYCIYNKIAVLEQKGSHISFLVEKIEDLDLQNRIKKAFIEYLNDIKKEKECPACYKEKPDVVFSECSSEQLRRCISRMYDYDYCSQDYNRQLKKAGENESGSVEIYYLNKKNDSDSENMSEVISHNDNNSDAAILLDSILYEARKRKSTDIHIEKQSVKFRINGLLEKYLDIQADKVNELIGRIKLIAGMNVIDKRSSQDGRFVFKCGRDNKHSVFVRVSSVPIIFDQVSNCESVVLRILDPMNVPLKLNVLGFSKRQLEKLEEIINLEYGLVLICGATCSGKSTTIAAMLSKLQQIKKNKLKIISLEDPPEYVLPNVSQIQIDEYSNNSFKEALNHIFRQDPDVIVIGEIRDEVSAAAALRASLTGHLVFATVHAANSGETILRMENLGLNRILVCSVIRAIICQSLSFINNKMTLYADVCCADETFASRVKNSYSESQIEELFEHINNYSSILEETVNKLRTENGEKLEKNMNHKRFFGGKTYVKRISSRVG